MAVMGNRALEQGLKWGPGGPPEGPPGGLILVGKSHETWGNSVVFGLKIGPKIGPISGPWGPSGDPILGLFLEGLPMAVMGFRPLGLALKWGPWDPRLGPSRGTPV